MFGELEVEIFKTLKIILFILNVKRATVNITIDVFLRFFKSGYIFSVLKWCKRVKISINIQNLNVYRRKLKILLGDLFIQVFKSTSFKLAQFLKK